ncbi:MAG: monovalent cation/H(+) antiporter subunit G [Verrucomicrobia bacterium]|nr:monovalent cation/H(+) antiporter subunit G [Verrucomicrobiota bacterium]
MAAVLMVAGSLFVLVAAVGVLRLPDVLCRMHAATKAGAFGTALLLVAAALVFASPAAVAKAMLVILFFYVTAPVAGHLLGRAAYTSRNQRLLLDVDEWRGRNGGQAMVVSQGSRRKALLAPL